MEHDSINTPTSTSTIASTTTSTTTSCDLVVVGAGLAGLTAARLAERGGARVVVLDGQRAGGRARSDVHDGFTFNRGPHALYRGGAAERVLGELGIHPTGGPPSTHAFGVVGGRVAALPATSRSLLSTSLLGWRGKIALGKLLTSFAKRSAAELAAVTAQAWLDDLDLPDDAAALMQMLIRVATYVNAPQRLSADVAVGQVQRALGEGVRYLDGGWQSLVDALAVGLDVRRGIAVAVRRDGRDVVVETAEDQRFVADAAIVAAGTPRAVAALVDRRPFDVAAAVEAACLDLGVDRIPPRPVLFGIDAPLYLSTHCPPARLAPPGRHVVQVARYLAPADDAAPAAQRAQLEAHASTAGVVPGSVIASRYLHRLSVVGALPTATRGGLPGRPAVSDSGIDGVLIAGDWVGAEGHLADAALASAALAARLALGRVGART